MSEAQPTIEFFNRNSFNYDPETKRAMLGISDKFNLKDFDEIKNLKNKTCMN